MRLIPSLSIGIALGTGMLLGATAVKSTMPRTSPHPAAATLASDVIAEVRANTEVILDRLNQVERNTAVLRGVTP